MMKRLLASLVLLTTLSSCGTFDSTVDRAGDRTEKLITHTTEELRGLKTEVLQETTEALSELKTEVLEEVRITIEDMMPRLIETALNADAVAFLIVSVVGLLGLVVTVALILLLGAIWTSYKRWQHPKDCSSR